MGKPTGFVEIARAKQPVRPVAERVRDWNEVYLPYPTEGLRAQGARCMDCGIPFCHEGCPLGNLIPDWNDLVYRDRWHTAIERHVALTGSKLGARILEDWRTVRAQFVKVMPRDYKRVVEAAAGDRPLEFVEMVGVARG